MTKEDLSFVADALLALCEKDRAAPFYSEEILDIKIRRGARRDRPLAELLLRRDDEGLLANEWRGVLRLADLTDNQREVFTGRLEGLTFEELGRRRRTTKQGAQRVFVQALKKLMRAWSVHPYQGLSDVYREETRRGRRAKSFGTIRR